MSGEGRVDAVVAVVRSYAADLDICERAELHMLEGALETRLDELGVEPSPEVGAVLMVVAHLLAEHTPEWGGDARASLAEVALLGLRLLEAGG